MAKRLSQNPQSAMVKWAQIQLTNYPRAAFCALVHHFSPDAIPEFDSLSFTPENSEKNLELAFQAAKSIGIEKLLDADDIVLEPDSKSIYTYLTMFHQVFEGSAEQGHSRLSPSGTIKAIDMLNPDKKAIRRQTGGLTRTQSEPMSETPKTVVVEDRTPSWKKKLAARKGGQEEPHDAPHTVPQEDSGFEESSESHEERSPAPQIEEPEPAHPPTIVSPGRRPSKPVQRLPPASAQLRLSQREAHNPMPHQQAQQQPQQPGEPKMVSPRSGKPGIPAIAVPALNTAVATTTAATEPTKPMSFLEALTSPRAKAAALAAQQAAQQGGMISPRSQQPGGKPLTSPRGQQADKPLSPRGEQPIVSPRKGQQQQEGVISPRSKQQHQQVVQFQAPAEAIDDDVMVSPRTRAQRRADKEKERAEREKEKAHEEGAPSTEEEDAAERKRRIDAAIAEYKKSRAMANQRREEIASTTADPVIDAKPEVPAKPAKKVIEGQLEPRRQDLEERKKRLSERRTLLERRSQRAGVKIGISSSSTSSSTPDLGSLVDVAITPISMDFSSSTILAAVPMNPNSDLQLALDDLRNELQRVTLERDKFELQVRVAEQMKEVAIKKADWADRETQQKTEQLQQQLTAARHEAQSAKESQKSTMDFARSEMARIMEEATKERRELQQQLDLERRTSNSCKAELEEALSKLASSRQGDDERREFEQKVLKEAKRDAEERLHELKEAKHTMEDLQSELARLKSQKTDLDAELKRKSRESIEARKDADENAEEISALKAQHSSTLSQLRKRLADIDEENSELRKSATKTVNDGSDKGSVRLSDEHNAEALTKIDSAISVLRSLQKVRTTFSWSSNLNAKEVVLRGNFDEWAQPHAASLAQSNGKTWSVDVELYPGMYQYKFIVDGEALIALDKPTVVVNQSGGVNNIKIVKGPAIDRSDKKLTAVLDDLVKFRATFS